MLSKYTEPRFESGDCCCCVCVIQIRLFIFPSPSSSFVPNKTIIMYGMEEKMMEGLT